MNIGIVVSDFNKEITHAMLDNALAHAKKLSLTVEKILHVPGAYDIPLAVKKLLEKKSIQGVTTLGAIIKGETKHDEIIANAVAKSLIDLSLEFNKPVSLGVTGPGMTMQQAVKRSKEVPERAIEALLKMHNLE